MNNNNEIVVGNIQFSPQSPDLSQGIFGTFKGKELYTEDYVKKLINTIAFLKSCVLCGENLSEAEVKEIDEILKSYRSI